MEKLEETKTAHLPRLVCLGVGLPVVFSKPTGQLVAVGVCNNSDGKTHLVHTGYLLFFYGHMSTACHIVDSFRPLLEVCGAKTFFSPAFLPGTIVSIDLDPREVISASSSTGYRVVHLVYPPTRVVIFIQSAYDTGLHIPPFNRGEIAVGVETRTFEVKGLHNKLYAFKRAQLPLLPGHLSSVYRAQVKL